MVVEYGEPWKVEEATQILHINHGEMQITSSPKFSGYFHFYRKHKDKFDRASRKYQLFTLYQIRNKRMTRRTLLTLFPCATASDWLMDCGEIMFLEDCRANSWSLRPCCMVLAYRIAHFCSVWRKKNVLNNLWAAPVLVLYRIITECILAMKFRLRPP